MRRVFSGLLAVAILVVPVASASAGLLHHNQLAKMTKQPLLQCHKPVPGESYLGKQPRGHCGACCPQ